MTVCDVTIVPRDTSSKWCQPLDRTSPFAVVLNDEIHFNSVDSARPWAMNVKHCDAKKNLYFRQQKSTEIVTLSNAMKVRNAYRCLRSRHNTDGFCCMSAATSSFDTFSTSAQFLQHCGQANGSPSYHYECENQTLFRIYVVVNKAICHVWHFWNVSRKIVSSWTRKDVTSIVCVTKKPQSIMQLFVSSFLSRNKSDIPSFILFWY